MSKVSKEIGSAVVGLSCIKCVEELTALFYRTVAKAFPKEISLILLSVSNVYRNNAMLLNYFINNVMKHEVNYSICYRSQFIMKLKDLIDEIKENINNIGLGHAVGIVKDFISSKKIDDKIYYVELLVPALNGVLRVFWSEYNVINKQEFEIWRNIFSAIADIDKRYNDMLTEILANIYVSEGNGHAGKEDNIDGLQLL
ncbi:hypothetical protein J4526_03160 [Desulfurococcaceae archaeon MEX13E-LK6-19]|nr:hypothetical protein J4526_03160 [Desulfurococcaceae archaeon MEX13E-LK6-19]